MVDENEQQLCQKLTREGCTNLSEWFKRIADEFCEEQAIEERVSIDNIKERFYTDLIEQFLFSLLTLLFRFLIDKGAGHIVEPRPLLLVPPKNTN